MHTRLRPHLSRGHVTGQRLPCWHSGAMSRTRGEGRTNEGHALTALNLQAGAVEELTVLVPAHSEALAWWQMCCS
jgi:hypothetical protein